MAAHEVQMRQNKDHERSRQQKHVRRVPTQQRQRAKVDATAHERGHLLAEERSAARDVDGDGRRPVGLLIPRQQVARQRKSQDEEQQDDARHPRDLARLLVRPEEDDAQHVDHGGDHDEARAEEVKSPDEPSERQPVGDVADAVVCELRRRHVVHRQDHAGHELQDEEEEEDAAGDEPPADARRQRLVEEM